MKSLKNIILTAKIARIIFLILFIIAIIGTAGIVLTMGLLPLVKDFQVEAGVTFEQYLFEKYGLTYPQIYYTFGAYLVTTGTSIYLMKHLEHYFHDIVKAGTPFSRECVKETRKCALVHVIVATSSVLVTFLYGIIMAAIFPEVKFLSSHVRGGTGILLALILLIFSFFFEYPVELNEKLEVKEEKNPEIEPEDYQE